jgi:hypothetical protein
MDQPEEIELYPLERRELNPLVEVTDRLDGEKRKALLKTVQVLKERGKERVESIAGKLSSTARKRAPLLRRKRQRLTEKNRRN